MNSHTGIFTDSQVLRHWVEYLRPYFSSHYLFNMIDQIFQTLKYKLGRLINETA
jgi:hypothetical protein